MALLLFLPNHKFCGLIPRNRFPFFVDAKMDDEKIAIVVGGLFFVLRKFKKCSIEKLLNQCFFGNFCSLKVFMEIKNEYNFLRRLNSKVWKPFINLSYLDFIKSFKPSSETKALSCITQHFISINILFQHD